jgi:uncharacterized protein DUF4157
MTDQLARVRHGFPWWLRPFLRRGVIGITIGRRVYLAADLAGHDAEALLRHELAHVRQVATIGFARFYFRYAVEYLRNRRAGMPAADAYRNISFEREAMAAEHIIKDLG